MPSCVMDALAGSSTLQAIGRFTTAPSARRAVTVYVYASPTFTRVAPVTTTVATGGSLTETCTDPVLPSLVAMTLAVPALTAVTTPDCDTVTTPLLLEDQDT